MEMFDTVGSIIIQRDRNAPGQANAEHPECEHLRNVLDTPSPGSLTLAGPAPNYVDPQTRVPLLMGISCAAGGFMVLLMASRLYTRGVMSKRGLGLDDWMMVVAAVFGVALVVIVCICGRYGTGYHQWDLRPEWSPYWGKATFCQNLALVLSATFTKISILLTYLYIFPQRSNMIFCWSGIGFISVFGTANIIVTCLQCTPISSYWDDSVQKKSCIDINTYLYTVGAINSLTDVIVYLWPSRTLFQLELPLAKRLGLCFTFSAGLVAVVASVARLVSVHKASYSDDSTYSGFFIALWKVLEITFGVICGCLPAVKPLVKPLLPKALLSSKKSRSAAAGPYGTGSFNRPANPQSKSYREVDLQPVRREQIVTKISSVGKRPTDSEECIMEQHKSQRGKWTR